MDNAIGCRNVTLDYRVQDVWVTDEAEMLSRYKNNFPNETSNVSSIKCHSMFALGSEAEAEVPPLHYGPHLVFLEPDGISSKGPEIVALQISKEMLPEDEVVSAEGSL